MKVVFLDIDGVMNNYNYAMGIKNNIEILKNNPKSGMSMINKLYPHVGDSYDYYDPSCVDVFNTIMEKTDANVVVSSAWRLMHSLDDLRDHFERNNMKCKDRVIDVTPDLGCHRGLEIDQWLVDHPEVTHFVIIDDGDQMKPHMSHLVLTDFSSGLEDYHLERIFKLLDEEL